MFVDSNTLGTKKNLKDNFGKSSLSQGGLVQCDDCRIIAHGIIVFHYSNFLQIYEFLGQLCSEISHSD